VATGATAAGPFPAGALPAISSARPAAAPSARLAAGTAEPAPAVVIVAVIVGVTFALTSGGHSTSGSAGGAAAKPVASWQALSAQQHALGTWSYGNSLVVAANTQVTAYNQVTGAVQALPSIAEQTTYAQALAGQPGLAQYGILVEVSGRTVVAGWLGVLAGFSLTTGAREWSNVLVSTRPKKRRRDG
jgi:hypothetical protein